MLNLHQPASRPTTDDVGLLLSQAESSAIEIASGRLFAGRPPAWTLPRRPPMRSPGAKRPLTAKCKTVDLRNCALHTVMRARRPRTQHARGSIILHFAIGAVSTACLSSYGRNSFRSPRPQSKAYWQTRPVPHTRTAATQQVQRFLPNCSLRRCGEMDILQATRR